MIFSAGPIHQTALYQQSPSSFEEAGVQYGTSPMLRAASQAWSEGNHLTAGIDFYLSWQALQG